METTWFWIGRMSAIFAFITIVPIIWSWYLLFTADRRRKKKMAKIIKNPGKKSAILLVEVDGDIEGQVRNWCEQQPQIKGADFYKVSHKGAINIKNLDTFVREIKKEISKVTSNGTDKIHLFFMGPAPLAAILGGILVNGCQVILYPLSRNTDELYTCWGPLKRDDY